MNLISYIKNPHKRIVATHFLVVFILSVNIIFFTQNNLSMIIQIILIFAVILHNKDDINLKNELNNSQDKLREDTNIFDRNIIVSESDLEGRITYVNQNFIDISGYSGDELIGKPHSLLRSDAMKKDFFKDLWATIQADKTFHGVIKNTKKDGSFYWVDVAISPIKKNAKIVGYKAIRFDITDKMLAKESFKKEITYKDKLLKEQANRFEFAINSSRDGFWDLDIENNEFFLSSGWKKRLGFKENEKVSYLDYLALIPEKERFIHHDAMQDVVDNYPNELNFIHFRVRYPLITMAGERLLIEDVGDAFFSNDGRELQRITGFHRDITEQARQARMIESQNRVAAMGDMIGNIAHQWRQPIGAINNVLNDLEFDIDLEDLDNIESEKFLATSKKVKEYTSHLSQTIDDFRKLTSDEKVKSRFLLIDVINEAHSILYDEYNQYNIKLSISLEGECVCELNGYKRELVQVVINILNNAKDIFLEKSISNPEVLINLNRNDSHIYITLSDNAGGVPEEIIEKIFDPYFTTKHESIGTGIGLFMSKKMITEHFNGSLEVYNQDKGAVFKITLPRQYLDKE